MSLLIECLLDFIISFGIWFAIVYFINFIINRRKIEKKKNIGIVLVISLVIAALATLPTISRVIQTQATESELSINISDEDETKLNEIIKQVMQDPNPLSVDTRNEFWSIMKKYNFSSQYMQTYKDIMTGVSTKYMKYFYQDSLIALKNGSTYKSSQRSDYEKHLIGLGIDEAIFTRNDSYIEKIAHNEAIDFQGTSVILTEEIINKILENIDTVSERIDELFTKP